MAGNKNITISEAMKHLRALERHFQSELSEYHQKTGLVIDEIKVATVTTLSGCVAFQVNMEIKIS